MLDQDAADEVDVRAGRRQRGSGHGAVVDEVVVHALVRLADSAERIVGVATVRGQARLPPRSASPTLGKAQALKIGKAKLIRRNGSLVARIAVSCPTAGASGCNATLSLTTAKPLRLRGVKVLALLGTKKVTLTRGAKATVWIRLATAPRTSPVGASSP
jgi:hypothetical protein